ncbi:MAG TPA: F0F1 ATP synthase subunit epsilon [Armatimonadota bacterium]|nr:F0F1 ATP synthase subunit epsilon [Armatimonadota bacterium]
MADTFQLNIVTPERTVFSGRAVSISDPGADGYFGVLARHAPMVAELGIRELAVKTPDGREECFAVCGGFVEVRPDSTTVLADTAESWKDIDLARAQEAALRARERLSNHEENIDVSRAEAALARATNRIHVVGKH